MEDILRCVKTGCGTVDLVILVRFKFSRISRGGPNREFKNLAKIIILIALLRKNENSRILIFVKSHKIKNSRKLQYANQIYSISVVSWTLRSDLSVQIPLCLCFFRAHIH